MKQVRLIALLGVAGLGGLLLCAAALVRPTHASIGNSGTPIACAARGLDPSGGFNFVQSPFSCVMADGTRLMSATVPSGYYFLVTDVVLSRQLPTTQPTSVTLCAQPKGIGACDNMLRIQASEHFVTPYLILAAGRVLEAANDNSAQGLDVYVSGLLVTNVSYVPSLQRD